MASTTYRGKRERKLQGILSTLCGAATEDPWWGKGVMEW